MRHFGLGCILLSTALSSSAVTLGRHSGAAVIGRPLDIRVQLLASEGEDLSALCIRAEVLYGDTLLPSGSVRSTPQVTTAPNAGASVRVQVDQPVDEPVVTVNVRAGCATPFTRRYVLLADLLSEPTSGTASPASARESVVVPAAQTSSALQGQPLPSSNAGGLQTPSVPAQTRKADRVTPGTGAASVFKRTAPANPAPRLELDPVDLNLAIERDPVLKLSLSLLSEPATNEEARKAAGQLWKAINASPEDVLRDSQKLAVLEAEAKGLRDQEARDKARIEAMEAQLQQSQWVRYALFALGGLLLLALLALAGLWKRGTDKPARSAAKAWWAAAQAEKAEPGLDLQTAARKVTKNNGLDLDLSVAGESAFDDFKPLGESGMGDMNAHAQGADKREFAPSMMGVSRSVATEELFDVQQQADFFMSLGEHEQAVDVLRNHLAESQEPSALAYLDLFRLYHKLNRRADYDQLRAEFNQLFNADAPPFDLYSDQSRGLEAYEAALSRIQALWPQPRVLDVIEQSIFREAGDAGGEVFDLEAYRELLLLHAIAKEVIKREAGDDSSSNDFQHTSIKPLKAQKVVMAGTALEPVERLTQPMDDIPPASPRLGLDVDLDALSEMSAFEASLPEVSTPVMPTSKPPAPPASALALSEEPIMDNLIDFEVLDFVPPQDGKSDKAS